MPLLSASSTNRRQSSPVVNIVLQNIKPTLMRRASSRARSSPTALVLLFNLL
jgi:hypothetical protein